MKNKFQVKIKYLLLTLIVLILICSMFFRTLPRWDVCYTADFPSMHVELYPQKSLSKNSYIYHDFILKLNDTCLRKNWKWKAGTTGSNMFPPVIYYADLNSDQKEELIFVFSNRIDYGISVLLEDIYVIDSTGNDHAVENPMHFLQEHSQITLSSTTTSAIVNIFIDEKRHQLFYPDDFFPDFKNLENNIGYPDWVQYHIENDRLSAEIPFVVYASMTIGYFDLQYEEIDGDYVITNVHIKQLSKEDL